MSPFTLSIRLAVMSSLCAEMSPFTDSHSRSSCSAMSTSMMSPFSFTTWALRAAAPPSEMSPLKLVARIASLSTPESRVSPFSLIASSLAAETFFATTSPLLLEARSPASPCTLVATTSPESECTSISPVNEAGTRTTVVVSSTPPASAGERSIITPSMGCESTSILSTPSVSSTETLWQFPVQYSSSMASPSAGSRRTFSNSDVMTMLLCGEVASSSSALTV